MDTISTFRNVSYLALGDSYTTGEGVTEKEAFPHQLQHKLGIEGKYITHVQIIARTGWTTDELSFAIDSNSVNAPFDFVTLLIGVNNQYRGKSVESYRPEFKQLLKQAIGFAAGKARNVVILSIPDWGVTPFAQGRDREKIAREIDAYNHINRMEAKSAGACWVDVTGISRRALQRPELLTSDGLHPSGLMYYLWVEAMLPSVQNILENNASDHL